MPSNTIGNKFFLIDFNLNMKNDQKNKSDHFSGIAPPKLSKTKKSIKIMNVFLYSHSSDVVCHFITNLMEIISF